MPVMVNQTEITDDEIYQEMQYHPAGSADLAIEAASRALVIRTLLLQKAAELNLVGDESPDQPLDEATIDALLSHMIELPEPDDETMLRFYQNNAHRFSKVDDKTPPFEDLKRGISDYLIETSWTNAVRSFIQALVQHATISGIEFKTS